MNQAERPSPEEFQDLVSQAIRSLPRFFRKKMENLSVEVEERPSAEVLERLGVQARSLLGLYQGVPLPKRTVWWNPTGPDRIILYRANILAQTRGPEEIQALVQEVVKHEIGHYFGLSEEELRRAQQTQ